MFLLGSVIVMTFWYVFSEQTYFFSNFLNFYFSIGIDHNPPCFLCSHDLCLFPLFLMILSSHDHMAKRSHYRIMIFYMTFGVLFYGRTPTLIPFHFLHNSTTPILPVEIVQHRSHLEKDTSWLRGMIVRQVSAVPWRTRLTPD